MHVRHRAAVTALVVRNHQTAGSADAEPTWKQSKTRNVLGKKARLAIKVSFSF